MDFKWPEKYRPTLADAKSLLQANLRNGTTCPCCEQFAKIYKRKFNSGMARHLIALHLLKVKTESKGMRDQFFHLSEIVTMAQRFRSSKCVGYDWPTARMWGLIEEAPTDLQSKKTSGYWRITEAGRDFVLRKTTIDKYVMIYNNRPIQFLDPQISITDALGIHFNYEEMMAA